MPNPIRGSQQFLLVDMQAEAAYGPHASQNNGFAAGESTFGSLNGSPVWRGVPIVEDGFGISPTATRAGEAVKKNIDQQAPGQLTGFDVGGALNPLAAPYDQRTAYGRSVLNWLLGAGINRSVGVVNSYSLRWYNPNIDFQEILGAKCNTLTIEGSRDSGIVSFSSEWVAAKFSPNAYSDPSPVFPLRNPKVAAGTGEPAAIGWAFARAYLLKANEGTTPTILAELRGFTVVVNNNQVSDSPKVDTVLTAGTVTDTYVINAIREGEQSISGTFQADYVDKASWDNLTQDDQIDLVIMARHPQSRAFGITAIGSSPVAPWDLLDGDASLTLDKGSGAVGDGATLSANNDYGLFAGGVVLIEDRSGSGPLSYSRDIGLIKTGYVQATGVVVLDDGLDHWTPVGSPLSETPGDLVLYDTAVGVRITGVKIDSSPLTGGPADIIGQDVQWTAGQFGSETSAIKWIGASPANAVS